MRSLTFCPLPWTMFFLEANGMRRLCCGSESVGSTGLEDSPQMRKVRLELLKGKKPKECAFCWRVEELGVNKSYRQQILPYDIPLDQARNNTKSYGVSSIPPHTFDLRLTDQCNISCRTCTPANSTHWYKDWYEGDFEDKSFHTHDQVYVQIQKKDGKYSLPVNRWEWLKDPSCWPRFIEMFRASVNFHGFCILMSQGGEPMVQAEHIDFVQAIINAGVAEGMILRYTTNLTTIPTRLTKLWKSFKGIEIQASLDGVGVINDYIRYPSKFSVSEKNIANYRDLGIEPVILSAVTTYSILNFPELIEYCDHHKLTLSPHIAWNPYNSKFSPFCMTKDFLMEAHSRLSKVKNLPDAISGILPSLADYDPKTNLVKEFWAFTRKLDELRDQRIEDYIPDLPKILKA